MRSPNVGLRGVTVALLWAASIGSGAQFTLILRPGGNTWKIDEVEKISFNNKDAVRVANSPRATDLRADEYRKLQPQPILRVGILRKHQGGYLVRRDGGIWLPAAPDNAPPKATVSYAGLWSAATVTVQRDRSGKSATTLNGRELFAILPGGNRDEAVANFLMDENNFTGVGERNADAAFEERMSLLVAVGPSLGPAGGAKLRAMLLSDMVGSEQRLASGMAPYSSLLAELKVVAVSLQAFPNDPAQQKARASLLGRKASVDRRIAILKAFSAGELWDALLDKYGDFEQLDDSFPDLRTMREKAFIQSVAYHRDEGQRLRAKGDFDGALRELQTAQHRNPVDAGGESLVDLVRIEAARARSKVGVHKAIDSTAPVQSEIRRHLLFAENYMNDKRSDEAEREILAAEVLDKSSLDIVLARAKLARARTQPLKALAILDEYDRRAFTSEEITAGEMLRGNVVYELKRTKESLKAAMADAERDGDYGKAFTSAQSGLEIDADDGDFLLSVGRFAAIVRKPAVAEEAWQHYLKLSWVPGAAAAQRTAVYHDLPKIKETIPEPEGPGNWFSGYKSRPGSPYCPISLTFNAHVARVLSANKQTTTFQWNGAHLVQVAVEQQPGGAKSTYYFDYFGDNGGVRRVSTEEIRDPPAVPKFTINGPVAAGKAVYTAMRNNPTFDPLMAQKLTGKNVATVVVGNAYFNPFAWDGIYMFMVEYDSMGRVSLARQVPVGSQQAPLHTFEFAWDRDSRLRSITERGSGSYQRTMSYTGGKLSSEVITFRGTSSKIEYRYKGDILIEAECGNDPTLDGHGRKVTF
jgi:tetratricopeptide (TPR) repeat protein